MNGTRAFLALAAAGTALRLLLIGTGACDNHVVADDAFYYFTIARNLVSGHGVSFDGLAPTNGFHPLWLLWLAPLYAAAQVLHLSSWTALRLALALCALLDLASGALLWTLLRRLGAPRGALAAAAVWFLSPPTVLLSLRGLEGALDVTLVALWLLLAAGLYGRGFPGARHGAGLGLVTGFAFLARTDNGPFLAVALCVMTALAARRQRPGLPRALAFLGATGAVTALVALPWFAWNLATFGTPWQVSGAVKLANPLVFGHVPAGMRGALEYLVAFVWAPAYFVAGESMRHRPAFELFWKVEAALLLVLLPFLGQALRRPAAAAVRPVVAGSLAYLAAHAVVYALVIRSYVIWYATVPTFLLVLLAAGVAGERLLARLPRAGRGALAALALLAACGVYAQFFRATGFRPRGEEQVVRPILTLIAQQAPEARAVGVFNAGAAGYFAPEIGHFTVVNLDGLVNNVAVGAWRQGRYLEYLERHVDVVIVDAASTLDHMLGPGGRARFEQSFPHWSERSLIYGRR